MSLNCPYSDVELDYWDGVSNPMGSACNECEEYECEHNPNPDPSYYEPDPYEGVNASPGA
jgi:hypothetical protein